MSNQGIIDELLSTSEYYESVGDDGRSCAYKRAVKSIETHGRTITSGKQAKQLKWIGDGIASKIDDILGSSSSPKKRRVKPSKPSGRTKNSHSRSSRNSRNSRSSSSTRQGVSVTLIDDIRSKARKRKDENLMDNMDEIKKPLRSPRSPHSRPQSKLNRNSRTLRIKQYEYAPKPDVDASVVSRAEIDQFFKCVKKIWDKLVERESTRGAKYRGKLECCGSFRRGKAWCHECVIVLSSDMSSARQRYSFKELLRVLYKLRLINSQRQQDNNSYQGVVDMSKLFKSQRTGDYPDKRSNIPLVLRLTDEGGWPCSLLRWTGPKSYWIKLQSAAQRQNFELLENGLYAGRTRTRSGGKRLFHRDEYDVMTDLDMGYLEPIYRQ